MGRAPNGRYTAGGPSGQGIGAGNGETAGPAPVQPAPPEPLGDGVALARLEDRQPTAQELRFIEHFLRHRDIRLASMEVGFSPLNGYKVIRRPHVRAAIARLTGDDNAPLEAEMGKSRLLTDLDFAIQSTIRAYKKKTKVRLECPHCARNISAEVVVQPRDIAQLTAAMSRVVEVSAKITGAMAPTKVQHQHSRAIQGSYADVVHLVRANPTAFTMSQREELRAAALEDRISIEVLLSVLATPVEALLASGLPPEPRVLTVQQP